MSLSVINNFLSEEDINYILTLSEVLEAKKDIDSKVNGSVYFSVNLTSSIKKTIFDKFGLILEKIPMRWIKGDTIPHIDTGSKKFEKTHLVYLTDSQGEFLLENNSYPMTKNSALVFNEGLRHETVDTGLEPRLLLGPMSEQGLAVGLPTTISGHGGTTVYLRDVGYGMQYSSNDQSNWQGVSFPISVQNISPSNGMFIVEFTTDITINDQNIHFICASDNIQFGLNNLNNDGTRPKIFIDGISDYNGFIRNYNGTNGYNSIYILNLEVLSTGTRLGPGAGWLCQSDFGKAASENYIVNCYSDGDITGNFCGGIVGDYAASFGNASMFIIGCSSSGTISGEQAGGIVGYNSGASTGSLTIQSCWSTGNITGVGAGGIVGSYGGYNGNIYVTNCYSTGEISGFNSGGIIGLNPGSNGIFEITNCYSTGLIYGNYSGGICAACDATSVTITGTISNCYSSGNVTNDNAGAICGVQTTSLGGTNDITIQNSYTCGSISSLSGNGYIIAGSSSIPSNCYSEAANSSSGWSDSHANSSLTGTPSVGYPSTWTTNGQNIPYNLFNMGYTPYSTTNIIPYSSSKIYDGPNLINKSSSIITAGDSTSPGIIQLNVYYAFLEDYSSLSINIHSATGAIRTTTSTPIHAHTLYIYTLYIYNDGTNGYNITSYTLTVTEEPTPTPTPSSSNFPVQRISLNQKSSFCGTRAVSATAVGIGAIRGKGSATRIFNNCKGNNSVNFQLCQLRVLGYK